MEGILDFLISIFGEAFGTHLYSIFLKVSKLYLIGLGFFFIEKIYPAQPDMKYFKKDFNTEICYPLFNFVFFDPIYKFVAVAVTVYFLEPFVPHQIFSEEVLILPFWTQIIIAMLITDIAVYIEHRFVHAYMWPYHALHHMTPEVSWLTSFRIHPINQLTIILIPAILTFFLGFSGSAIIWASFFTLALSYYQHANINIGYPKPFCYFLVSPRFHRWHHANEKGAIDKNFCLAFPFIDIIGRTYYCPERLPHGYGVYHRPDDIPIPKSFFGQLWYPFHKTLITVRKYLKATKSP